MAFQSLQSPIILFDGACNLCQGSVQWIIAHDPRADFRFASLQSRAANEALARANCTVESLPQSIILIDGEHVLMQSDAVMAIAAQLGFPWSMARLGRVLPRSFRDWLYQQVAARRYRWFGKPAGCLVPTPELRQRFLDADEPAIQLPDAQRA